MGSGVQQNLIFALHGFLGQGSDWASVQTQTDESITWMAPDLFSPSSLDVVDFDSYVEQLMEKYNTVTTSPNFQKKIFVGYSLGGRLGMHLLKKYADRFDQFVFVSAHPGLRVENEKIERIASDLMWASTIQMQSWALFLQQWNDQAIFSKKDPEPERREELFDKIKLADAMVKWSLGVQEDLRELIHLNNKKIIWAVGESDLKFLNIAFDLQQKKILLGHNKIFSGHRILFSNPKDLGQLLQNCF